MWCKSLRIEKYISFRMKWFFWPPFLSVSPFLLLNLARRQSYAYAIGLYTRPEIKSWPDIKFCAHAHCVLPRCCSRVGIIFYPPKPHRSRGTEIEFWTPCDMLYQRKMPTMFWCIRLSGIRFFFALSFIIFGRSRSRQQRMNITSITVFRQILYMKF